MPLLRHYLLLAAAELKLDLQSFFSLFVIFQYALDDYVLFRAPGTVDAYMIGYMNSNTFYFRFGLGTGSRK